MDARIVCAQDERNIAGDKRQNRVVLQGRNGAGEHIAAQAQLHADITFLEEIEQRWRLHRGQPVANSRGTTGFNGKANMLWRSDLSRMNRHTQTELFCGLAQQLGKSMINGERFVSGNIKANDLRRAPERLEGVQRVSDVPQVYLCPVDTQDKSTFFLALSRIQCKNRDHRAATASRRVVFLSPEGIQ